MPDLTTPVFALVLGAALARANSCTVASARRLVVDRNPDWLLGLGIAISWAGVTLAAVAMFARQVVVFPAALPLNWPVLAGGVILGIGATINQGCFLGSIARLGRGELAYAFTLAGIALAISVLPVLRFPLHPVEAAGGFGEKDRIESLSGGILFLPLAFYGVWRWWRFRRQTVLALIVVGLAGGAVYACNPDWSYASGLQKVIASGGNPSVLLAESWALAVVVGVMFSAISAGTFLLQLPNTKTAATRLAGGLLLGTGAMLVPGGNDTLMLWVIPGVTLYGLVAYGTMILTIVLLMALMQRSPRRRHPR